MPAKPSEEIKTRMVYNKQKNGDVYVLVLTSAHK